MANEVYMDIPAVKNMANTLGKVADVLKAVAKTLEALANILKSTAFIGLVGGGAVLAVIEMIKPYIKKMADKAAELKKDVLESVMAYERGDAQGATRFY
jgi:hypothetical protein